MASQAEEIEVMALDSEVGLTAEDQAPALAEGLEGQAAAQLVPNEEPSVMWMRQCSKHLAHIEGRLMENEYFGHEVVRQVGMAIESFRPSPYGDWGWMMRKCQDIAVRTLRHLVRIYHKQESIEIFLMRAVNFVRLYFEEAFHRCLLGCGTSLRKAAMCNLMITMKNFEADTFSPTLGLGIFSTFTEANVRALATRVAFKEVTSIEVLPSYAEVMRSPDMRIEAFSLMVLRTPPSSIVMSKAEVKALIEGTSSFEPVPACMSLPGVEGPSFFEAIFDRSQQGHA